jgi:hypothetical protein
MCRAALDFYVTIQDFFRFQTTQTPSIAFSDGLLSLNGGNTVSSTSQRPRSSVKAQVVGAADLPSTVLVCPIPFSPSFAFSRVLGERSFSAPSPSLRGAARGLVNCPGLQSKARIRGIGGLPPFSRKLSVRPDAPLFLSVAVSLTAAVVGLPIPGPGLL